MKKIYMIAKGLNNRFGGDDDPFRITTRLLEEAGEVASEVNHLERCGLKKEKAGEPDRKKLAKELQQVSLIDGKQCHYFHLMVRFATRR